MKTLAALLRKIGFKWLADKMDPPSPNGGGGPGGTPVP